MYPVLAKIGPFVVDPWSLVAVLAFSLMIAFVRRECRRMNLPDFLMIRINSVANDLDNWRYDVDVFLRRKGDNYEIVGIERAVGFEVQEIPP